MNAAAYQSQQEIICETPSVRIAEITLAPHSDTPDHQHTEAEEICYCLQGELTCEAGNGRTVLKPGDKMRFAATHHHRLRNLASSECRFLLIHDGGKFDFVPGSRPARLNPERDMTMTETKSVTKDPICGMTVDESTALHAERDGKTYYFCSDGCRQKFLSMPAGAKPDGKSGCCCG